MRKLYEIVGLGGTFDRFHAGHEHFIKFASQFGQHLHVGITHPKLTQGKELSKLIEPYSDRKRAVIHYCKLQQISGSTSQLTDIYGPTLNEKSKIKALVVTPDTLAGANKINQTRAAMNLYQFPVHICPLLTDKHDQVINSARIRAGEIDRQGNVYQDVFENGLNLTTTHRDYFSKPQGQIVSHPQTHPHSLVCVVGDDSLEQFITQKIDYDLAIYDQKRQRKLVSSNIIDQLNPDLKTTNPAGAISPDLITSLQTILASHKKHLLVDGEEDLAAVALIMLTPLETIIYYGQPQQGLVMMKVTEELKESVYQLLKR